MGVNTIEENRINHKDNKGFVFDRKKQLLDRAKVLFFENGYDNTPIRALSKAAGLSNAGIYYFFKDKEDILFNILYESVNNLNNTLKAAICIEDDPQRNLEKVIENLLKHVIGQRMEIVILNRENGRLNEEQTVLISKKIREAYDLVKKELAKLQEQGKLKSTNLTPAVFAIFSMTNWFVRWYDPGGALTLEELKEEITSIFFGGILKSDHQ